MRGILENVRGVNLPRGTKSYLHASNKKARRNWDAEKLDYIQKNLNLPSLRELAIKDDLFSTPNKIRVPDLTVQPLNKNTPAIIIEHDTVNIHGELASPNEKTKRRNCDYIRAKRPFVIVNEDLAKLLGLDEASLARYLVEHEKARFIAYKEVNQI